MFFEGEDAGACKTVGWNAVNNRGWGILDVSQFGSHHFAPHVSANRIGPYRTMANTAGATFLGAYQELNQGPSEAGAGTVVVGGTPGGGWIGTGLRFLRTNNIQPMIRLPHEDSAECDLRIMSVGTDSDEQNLIRQFEDEFERRKNVCAVLIVTVASSSPKRWTIAGFNDLGEFESIQINDPNNDLAIELNKSSANKNRVIKLATSILGRTYPVRGGLRTSFGNTNHGYELRRYSSDHEKDDYVLNHFRRAVRNDSDALVQDYYVSTQYPSQEWMGPYVRGSGLIRYPRGIVIGKEPQARRILFADPSRLPPGVYDIGDVILDSTGETLAQRPVVRFALGKTWTPGDKLRVGDVRTPTTSNDFAYVASVAKDTGGRTGVTDAIEPTWPRVLGQTVLDGTVLWDCWGADVPQLST